MFEFPRTRMIESAKRSGASISTGRQIAFFFLIFGIGMLGQLLFLLPAQLLGDGSCARLMQLFGTLVMIVACVVFCRRIEKRSYMSMGMVARGAVGEYLVGLLLGFAMFFVAVGVCLWTGQVEITLTPTPSIPLLIAFGVGFLLQGMSEELLCRSFLMMSLSRGCKLWVCVGANALLFAGLHLFNDGITPLALLNLTLFGLFASIYTLRRGSIWGICAIHSMWNFTQGNIFGVSVSGLSPTPSIYTATIPPQTSTFINGGSFGLEGGLAVTGVLLFAIIIALWMPTKKTERV